MELQYIIVTMSKKFGMPLSPPLVLEVGSGPQVPTFRNSTYLDPQVGLTKNLGARHLGPSSDPLHHCHLQM